MLDPKSLLETSLYFLALINPVSKVLLLSTVKPRLSPRDLRAISLKASLVAFLILFVLTLAGLFLFKTVFRIDIYSLKIAGGFVLFVVGSMAVREGRFFERKTDALHEDISIVPLAAPLIAGPGTIAGAMSFSSERGAALAIASLTIALTVNLIVMLFSQWIGNALEKVHATGPLIRITGLVVMALAVQMILNGVGDWLSLVGLTH
jgi:multiple antibiotic resistance protein